MGAGTLTVISSALTLRPTNRPANNTWMELWDGWDYWVVEIARRCSPVGELCRTRRGQAAAEASRKANEIFVPARSTISGKSTRFQVKWVSPVTVSVDELLASSPIQTAKNFWLADTLPEITSRSL